MLGLVAQGNIYSLRQYLWWDSYYYFLENFGEFIYAKLSTTIRKQNLIDWDNAPDSGSTLSYIIQSKEKMEVGYIKSTGDRVGKWEKAKQGDLWDLIFHVNSFKNYNV